MAKTNGTALPAQNYAFVERADLKRGRRLVLQENEIAHDKVYWCDIYTGTAAALIGTGLIERHMLPGEPGRNKINVTISEAHVADGHEGLLRIIRKNSRHFDVYKGVSKEEEERRIAAQDAARELKKAKEQEARALAELPMSDDEFKKRAAFNLKLGLQDAWLYLAGQGGYSFDKDTFDEIRKTIDDLFYSIVSGGTHFDLKARQECISAIKARTSKVDAPLQSFLQRVTADAGNSDVLEHEASDSGA